MNNYYQYFLEKERKIYLKNQNIKSKIWYENNKEYIKQKNIINNYKNKEYYKNWYQKNKEIIRIKRFNEKKKDKWFIPRENNKVDYVYNPPLKFKDTVNFILFK